MRYFSLRNLSSAKVEDLGCPSDNVNQYPEEFKNGKHHKKFTAWRSDINTDWQFYSLCEGLNPNQRIVAQGASPESSNPIRRIHGVVLDFDAHGQTLQWGLAAVSSILPDLQPTWITSTFRFGFRLVWDFQTPLLCPTAEVFKEFIKIFCEVTRAQTAFPQFDEKANCNCSMFFDKGREWGRVSGTPISQQLVEGLMLKASEKALWKGSLGEASVDDIAKLVEKRFPNKWQGAFAEGMRGCRFWDTQADNPTAAIVRRTGMQCFTGDIPFRRWADIFGPAEIEALTAESTSRVINDFYYDGKAYHSYNPITGRYRLIQKAEEFKRFVKQYYKINKDRFAEIQSKIEEERAISMAVPMPFLPRGVHRDNQGKKVLNTSELQLLLPSMEACEKWGYNFPHLAQFFDQLFGSVSPQQQEHFIAYLSYYYKNCHAQTKSKAQVTFIAGPPGTGKSFLVNAVLGKIFASVTSAGSYLVDQDQYNDHLFESPVWVLDDEAGNSDTRVMARYTNMLKQIAANHNLRYRPMYSSGGNVEWYGRLFVTLNEDYKSLEILPDMDLNNKDKINFYRAGKTTVDFQTLNAAFPAEAPYFCRYLLDLVIPDRLKDSRFGTKAYHEGEVLKKTDMGSRSSMDSEILKEFRRLLFDKELAIGKEYLYYTPLQIFGLVQAESLIAAQTARSHWSNAFRFHRLLFALEKDVKYLRSISTTDKGGYFVLLAPRVAKDRYEEVFSKARAEIEALPSE